LLHNTIHSLNAQNKIREQNMMWKMFDDLRNTSPNSDNNYTHPNKRKNVSSDDEDGDDKLRPGCSNNKNYWLKKLVKEEEKQAERWGHTGYKELYPEDFESSQEDSHSDSSTDIKKKKAKKKKSREKKAKKKKSKKHKKHKRK